MRYEEPTMEIVLFELEQVHTDIVVGSNQSVVPDEGVTWGPPFQFGVKQGYRMFWQQKESQRRMAVLWDFFYLWGQFYLIQMASNRHPVFTKTK